MVCQCLQGWVGVNCSQLGNSTSPQPIASPPPPVPARNLTVVSTYAGSGTPGFTDGVGTAAQFSRPVGVAAVGGNLYVTDGNFRIRKIDASLAVSTFAGSSDGFADGSGTNAMFNGLNAIAADAAGNLYVADAYNHRVRKIDSFGTVSTLAGNPTSGYQDGQGTNAMFTFPNGVAVAADGTVYVTEPDNHVVRKISPTGLVTTLAGQFAISGWTDSTGTAALFDAPFGVALDAAGNLYVADSGNHRIRKIVTSTGVVSTLVGNSNGGNADSFGTSAQFGMPFGVAVDAAGNVYVSDYSYNNIRRIGTTGVTTTVAGLSTPGYVDGAAGTAMFDAPAHIALNASGYLFVAGNSNFRIRLISPAPTIPQPPSPIPPPIASPPPFYSLYNTLSVYYAFDDSTVLGRDSGPDGNNTLQATSYWPNSVLEFSLSGKYGGALHVSGCDALSASSFPSRMAYGNQPYTVMFWVSVPLSSLTGIPGGSWIAVNIGRWINCFTHSNDANAFGINSDGTFGNGWICNDINSPATVANNSWRHLAATYDGTHRTLYVDGIQTAQDSPCGVNCVAAIQAYSFSIGSWDRSKMQFDYGPYCAVGTGGYLDDVAVFSSALSPESIRSFAAQQPPPSPPPSPSLSPSPSPVSFDTFITDWMWQGAGGSTASSDSVIGDSTYSFTYDSSWFNISAYGMAFTVPGNMSGLYRGAVRGIGSCSSYDGGTTYNGVYFPTSSVSPNCQSCSWYVRSAPWYWLSGTYSMTGSVDDNAVVRLISAAGTPAIEIQQPSIQQSFTVPVSGLYVMGIQVTNGGVCSGVSITSLTPGPGAGLFTSVLTA
jgi:sugar lactone lactonase YvrE